MVAVMTANGTTYARYTLVVGLGASGLAAARHLVGQGEPVLVIDSRAAPPGLKALAREEPEVGIELGTLDPRWLAGATRVVVSPGLAVDLPLIVEAKKRGIEIAGELELFARAAAAPVIAITGSNGKSTVTSLVAALLRAQGFNAPAGGNLGPPALELLALSDVDAYVVEVSSFQLETTRSLKPLAAALLNISPDHIDRHGSLDRYASLKGSLLTSARHPIFNRDDPLVRELAPRDGDAIAFSVAAPLADGWSVVEKAGERWLARRLEPLIRSADLGLAGVTGEANSLAALALADCMGGDLAPAVAELSRFRGLAHRLELVCEHNGVHYIDDSKGTNVGATVAALASSDQPTVLIAGGQSKGADFRPLAEAVERRVKAVILIGEAAGPLESALSDAVPTVRAVSLEAAVEMAAAIAEPGDRVLLSPACASQDMFVDYRDRGDSFARAVKGLPK